MADSIVFRPLPQVTVRGHVPVPVEIKVPNGFVFRYLALPADVGPHLCVGLREGDHGFPGPFFVVGSLGPESGQRGGYVGRNVGPKTAMIWFWARNESLIAIVSGAFSLEPEEPSP